MRTATVLARTLVGLGAVVVTVLPTAASAEQWTHRDPSGDVVQFTYDEETEEETATELPDDVSTDVRRLTVTHAPHQLRVAMRVQDIVRGPRYAVFRVRTAEDRRFVVFRMRARGFSSFEILAARNGEPLRCAGKSGSMGADTDRVLVTLPRRCLGDPRWVQVGAAYVTFSEYRSGAELLTNADDALRDGIRDNLGMSPRIRRG